MTVIIVVSVCVFVFVRFFFVCTLSLSLLIRKRVINTFHATKKPILIFRFPENRSMRCTPIVEQFSGLGSLFFFFNY